MTYPEHVSTNTNLLADRLAKIVIKELFDICIQKELVGNNNNSQVYNIMYLPSNNYCDYK